MKLLRLSILFCLLAVAALYDGLAYGEDSVSASTDHLKVALLNGDLNSITNKDTQERYSLEDARQGSGLSLDLLSGATDSLRCAGWHPIETSVGGEKGNVAEFADANGSVTMSVSTDPRTQEIVIRLRGTAMKPGLRGLTWWIRGLNLSTGRLVLPALGGSYADKESAPASLDLKYPALWEAKMAVWEGKKGGFMVYSPDTKSHFNCLHIRRTGDSLDLGLETSAVAPWSKATGVPEVEWRIASFQGDWRTPASNYRRMIDSIRPAIKPGDGRAWVNEISVVVTDFDSKLDPAMLDSLSQQLVPHKTLLYLPNWRLYAYDVNYPDYTPNGSVKAFVDRAHKLGFRTRLLAFSRNTR